MLEEQAEQIFAVTDDIAERVRKVGGTTTRSVGHINCLKHVADNDANTLDLWTCLANSGKTTRLGY
jgi:starvation-inducible DNA-binding protein